MSRERQSMRVTIRVRPLTQKEASQDSRVCIKVEQETHSIMMGSGNDAKKFTFDQICDNETQQNMFKKVGQKSAQYCLQGYNCTVFAYGQTGAGKTFTMMGVNYEDRNSYELRGIIPRTLEYLFQRVQEDIQSNGTEYYIKCYFVQIYNEQMMDLLNKQNTNIRIRENVNGVFVEGVEEYAISRPDEAMELLKRGSRGRHVGSTCYNQCSSRSHSVFTMNIESKSIKNGVVNTKSRYFHFVDLAGSERTKLSMGQRLKEGCSINKSLHVLGKVINSLADYSEGKTQHVNYRDSKLTFLLKQSLSGNSKTHLIANIHPGMQSYHQTISTLSFARRVKLIKLKKAEINQDMSGNLEALKCEIKRLKQQIIRLRSTSSLEGQSSNPACQSNDKMRNILHQYVSQELEKETKLQMEIQKLKSRLAYIQKGIEQYSNNETHLRMIISVYEDKFRRTKLIQDKIDKKAEQFNPESEQGRLLKEYFENERQQHLREIKTLKQLVLNGKASTGLIRKVLQQTNVLQNEQNQEALVQILTKNSDFLREIKDYVQDQLAVQSSRGNTPAPQLNQLDKKFKLKERELIEQIQKISLEAIELKENIEENESMLREAVDAQISVQKKNQQLTIANQELMNRAQQFRNKNCSLEQTFEQKLFDFESKIASLTVALTNSQRQLCQANNQIHQLKQKVQTIEESNLNEEHENRKFTESLQKSIVEKQDENHLLKSQLLQMEIKIKNMENCNQQLLETVNMQEKTLQDYIKGKQETELRLASIKHSLNQQLCAVNQQLKERSQMVLHIEECSKRKDEESQRQHQQMNDTILLLEKNRTKYEEDIKEKEARQKELMSMLEEKELTGNETTDKLNSLQMDILKYQNKIAQLEKKAESQKSELQQNLRTLTKKKQQTQYQVTRFHETHSQFKNELRELKDTLKYTKEQLNLNQISLSALKIDHQELAIKYSTVNKQNTQLREREKQLKVRLLRIQNEGYVNQKNYEIELEATKELLSQKENSQQHLERELHRNKEHFNKTIAEMKAELENQRQLFKTSEQSIKRAMEVHLSNKEQKITQLKSTSSGLHQQLNASKYRVEELNQKVNQLDEKLTEVMISQKMTEQQAKDLSQELYLSRQELQEIKITNQKQMQENQVIHNEQLDQKNQQLEAVANELQTAKNDLKAITKQLANKESRISQYQNLTRDMQKQIESLEDSLNCAKENMQMRELSIQRSEQDLRQLENTQKEEFDGHRARILYLETSLSHKMTEIEQYVSQLQQAHSQLQVAERQALTLRGYISEHESFIKNLIEEKSVQQQFFNKEKQSLIDQLKQIDTLYREKESEFSEKELSLKEHEQTISKLKSQHHDLFKQFENSETNKNGQKQEMESLQIELLNVKNSSKVYEQEAELARQEIEKAQQEVIFLNGELQQYKRLIRLFKLQNQETGKTLNEQTTRLQQENKQLAETNLQLRYQIDKNQHQSAQQIKQLKCQEERTRSSLQNNYVYRQQHDELKEALTRKKEYIIQKDEQLQKLDKELRSLESNFHDQTKELTKEFKLKEDELKEVKIEFNRERELRINLQAEFEQLMNLKREQLEHMKRNQQNSRAQISNNSAKMIKIVNNSHRLQSDLEESKQQIEDLKMLIYNTEAQKNQLYLELQEEKNIRQRLMERITKKQEEQKNQPSSQHYLKTVQLLEKSRSELIDTKKHYDDQRKVIKKLKEELKEKEKLTADVQTHAEQYCKSQQEQLASIQQDYFKLQSQHQHLLREMIQLEEMKNELKSCKGASSTASLIIEQLEEKLRIRTQQMTDLQTSHEDLKKHALRGNNDQQKMKQINHLKQEISMLKNKAELLKEQLDKEIEEKVRLKSQKRYGKELNSNMENCHKNQIQKKTNEVKYLQEIIAEGLNILGVKKVQTKYKNDSIRANLVVSLKELMNQVKMGRERVKQLEEEMQIQANKLSALQRDYSQMRARTKVTASSDNQNTLNNIIRSKISKVQASFATLRQSVDAEKSPLRSSKQINNSAIGNRKH